MDNGGAQKKFTSGNPFFGRRPLNSSERRKVETLLKRANHLERRINANPRRSMDYDWQELSALRWAIWVLDETPENKRLRESLRALTEERKAAGDVPDWWFAT